MFLELLVHLVSVFRCLNMLFQTLILVTGAACVLARSIPDKFAARQAPSATSDAPSAQATICGDIVANANEGMSIFMMTRMSI
jgi:hypothetical protein